MKQCKHPCCGEVCRKKKAPKPRKPIKKKSLKQCSRERQYAIIRRAFMKSRPHCQAKLEGCQYAATDVHHKKGRGEYYLDLSTWIAVCRSCHRWIEDNPAKAKELALSENRL